MANIQWDVLYLLCSIDREREVLKDHLMEDLDYSLVPEEVWKKFTSWYGIEESSRVISRRVVEHGLYVKHCKVEVYLVEFKLALHPDIDSVVTKKFSRADNVGESPDALIFYHTHSKIGGDLIFAVYLANFYTPL